MMSEFDIPAERGTYALMLHSRVSLSLQVGALGNVAMCPGFYVYVGSAFGPGGLRARISRHIKRSKKHHWHIDYVREHADLQAVWFDSFPAVHEHEWATEFARSRGIQVPFPRFGASDCRCASHLFYSETEPSLASFRDRLESQAGIGATDYEATDPGIRVWRQRSTAR